MSYRWKLQTFSLLWYLHFISKQGRSEKKKIKLVSEPGIIPLFIKEKWWSKVEGELDKESHPGDASGRSESLSEPLWNKME